MRLNLNDNIKVKLTEHGKDIYYHQYDRTNAFLGRELCKPSYPKVDEDGYTTFQLWCFMELYGVHMGMTLPNVIKPLEIVFNEPTIEPEPRWIPCGERLPEVHWFDRDICYSDTVLVTEETKHGSKDVKMGYRTTEGGGEIWWDAREGAGFAGEIIAWMPLPEPWGGEQDE